MKYLLLCCFEEKRWEAMPEAQRDGIMREYGELLRSLDQSGHHLATGQLQPTSTATTVRGRNGRPARHRRALRRNQGAAWGLPPGRVQGPRRSDFDREAHSDDSPRRHGRGAAAGHLEEQ